MSTGARKNPSAAQAAPAIIDVLRTIQVALISDQLHRNVGTGQLKKYDRSTGTMAGTAVTVRVSHGDNLAVLRAFEYCRPGDVMVIDGGGDTEQAILAPSIGLLLVLLSLFGWMGLSDYVRAEFLRNRQLDYVKAARALGVPNRQIIFRHILPNSMTPVVTFLPFRMSAAVLALTSLDFLGLGVPPGTPSLGELLSQGKNNIDAWWISLSTFVVLALTLLLLTFMGDALRDALDPRKAQ